MGRRAADARDRRSPSPMPARRALALLLPLLAAHGCTSRAPAPPPRPPAAPSPAPSPFGPARYLAVHTTWIEQTPDGVDRVIADGRRMEVRRFAILHTSDPAPEVDGGARSPAWTKTRYLFWKGKQLYSAQTFLGDLTPMGDLPSKPKGTFDWLNGTGLRLAGGALVVPDKGPPAPLGVPIVVDSLAADEKRAIVTTALGHTAITIDGGATWREASELRSGVSFSVRGGDIAVTMRDGRRRFVTATGAIDLQHADGPARGQRPPEEPATFPGGHAARAIELASKSGIASGAGDHGAVVTDDDLVGRLDLDTWKMTSIASLDGLASGDCTAFRAADGPLLVCADETRATVIDLSGAPRAERTFDLAGAGERVRFTGADGEAIGYVGPCDGPAEPTRELIPGGEPLGFPRQQSSRFCVRAGRDVWIEHRLDPEDTSDLLAWIPRKGGGAAAIVARRGTLMEERERVSVRGALRVVRVARGEPPFSLLSYGWEATPTLDRSLRIQADDTIEGWIPASGGATGVIAVTLDASGRARAWPAPVGAGSIHSAGPLALTRSDDGKLWETIDGGHRWILVDPPPSGDARPSSCSPFGCSFGAFVRVGWTQAEPAVASPPRDKPRGRSRTRRASPSPALLLSCAFDAPPTSSRVADRDGFRVPTGAVRRSSLSAVGTLGAVSVPRVASGVAASGDVEIGWIAPLDTSATIRRARVPVSLLATKSTGWRSPAMPLGWLLADDGRLDAIPLGRGDRCQERVLATAGVARAVGGGADDRTAGVEIGGRTFAVQVAYQSIAVSAGTVARRERAPARGSVQASRDPASLRLLTITPTGAPLHGFSIGVGARARSPVVIVIDHRGDAVLAPIDPRSGAIGAEERVRSLREAAIGSDPACAPRPDDARVVLPFEGLIGLHRGAPLGVLPEHGAGVAIVRWSRSRACLDAIEIPVRDERFDEVAGSYEAPGAIHKVIATLGGSAAKGATLVSIAQGSELRQKLVCTKVVAGE